MFYKKKHFKPNFVVNEKICRAVTDIERKYIKTLRLRLEYNAIAEYRTKGAINGTTQSQLRI